MSSRLLYTAPAVLSGTRLSSGRASEVRSVTCCKRLCAEATGTAANCALPAVWQCICMATISTWQWMRRVVLGKVYPPSTNKNPGSATRHSFLWPWEDLPLSRRNLQFGLASAGNPSGTSAQRSACASSGRDSVIEMQQLHHQVSSCCNLFGRSCSLAAVPLHIKDTSLQKLQRSQGLRIDQCS